MICSIFPLIAGYFYANYIGKKVRAADEADAGEVTKTYEELVAEYGKLPGGWDSMAPIIVPIILMALSSISSMAGMTGPVKNILTFLGTPIIALAVGTIFAVIQLKNAGKMGEFYNLTNDTLKTVGPILFVTAAGGVLGKVIASSDMVNYITEHATVLEAMGIFFPFVPVGDPQVRTGFLHRRPYNHGRYRGSSAPSPGTGQPRPHLPGLHGHRRRRYDCIPCQRLLLLGRHQLRCHDSGSGL